MAGDRTQVTGSYSRTFLCVAMPRPVQQALTKIHRLTEQSGVRLSFTSPETSHLTLLFIGSLVNTQAADIISAMDRICSESNSFKLQIGGGGYFGPSRSPKVIWAGIKSSIPLMNVQGAFDQQVREMGIPLENQPFVPHVTVARVKSQLPPGALTSIMGCINNTHFDEVPVDRVLFMNSLLNGSGPRYTVIHQAFLKGQSNHG